MFYMVFDFVMAVLMLLFGVYFYSSKGKAARFLSGYNRKPEGDRKKHDEDAMCRAYGKRMAAMSLPFILGIVIDMKYPGIGCLAAWGIWLVKNMEPLESSFSEKIVYSECYGSGYYGLSQYDRWI